MSTYFERLGEELRLATERRYELRSSSAGPAGSRSRQPGGRMDRLLGRARGRWPLAALLVAVVGAGSAAAATIPLLGGSQRLAGSVPAAALQAPGPLVRATESVQGQALPRGLRYAVPVTPDIEPGTAGWCGSPVYLIPGRKRPLAGASACVSATRGSTGIIGGGEPLTNLADELHPKAPSTRSGLGEAKEPRDLRQMRRDAASDVQLDWSVVSSRVHAIRIAGTTFPTYPDPDLPGGWRALVIFARGRPLRFTDLDAQGEPLPPEQLSQAQSSVQARLRSTPIRHVDPRQVPAGICGLGPADLPGLGSQWEVLAGRAPSLGASVEAGALFSCARAWYAFPGSHAVYSAAILLDARSPGQSAPEPPGLTPGPEAGSYEEDAALTGEITARRIGRAWLLVQGPDVRLREKLLHDIPITGEDIG